MSSKKKIETGIDNILSSLNKEYGEATIVGMNDHPNLEIERIPTGSLLLDRVLDGGYPKGKVIELFGDEGVGKSTLALHFLSNVEGDKLYVDTEQALDRAYAESLNVSLDNMYICQPDYTEQALEIVRQTCTHVDAVVYDSVAEATTKNEIEKEIGERNIGTKAYVFGQAMRLLKGIKHKGTLLFINQVRENPGITYGSNRVTPAGKALKFASHVRLDVRYGGWIKSGEETIGHYIKVNVVKNKLGVPHQKVNIPLIYDGNGISRAMEVLELCLDKGLIVKSGSWYKTADGDSLAQGLKSTITFMTDNPDYIDELYQKCNNDDG